MGNLKKISYTLQSPSMDSEQDPSGGPSEWQGQRWSMLLMISVSLNCVVQCGACTLPTFTEDDGKYIYGQSMKITEEPT